MSESDSILHEQVAKLAYEIWESKGRPTATAEIDWLEAEQFLEFGDPEKPPFGASLHSLDAGGTTRKRDPRTCT